MRNGFVFLKSYYEAIRHLSAKYRLEMYDAICEYGLYGTVPELSDKAKTYFMLIQPNMDSAAKRYLAAVENGKKGGRPKKTQPKPNQNPAKTQMKPKQNLDVDADADEDKDVDWDADADADAAGFATAEICETDFFKQAGEAEEVTKNRTKENKGNVVALLPLKNGTEFPVFQADVDEWQMGYPNIDVKLALVQMKLWLISNPQKGRTLQNIHRFITNWLSNAWNAMNLKTASGSGKPPAAPQTNAPGFDVDEFFDNAVARSRENAENLDGEDEITFESW